MVADHALLLPHTHCTPERRANLVTVGPRRRTEAQTGNGELAIKHRRHSRFNPVGRHSPNCANRVICPFWHATKMRLFSFNLWSSVSSCCAPGLAPWTRPACARGSMWVTKYRGVRRFDLLTLVYMYTAVSYNEIIFVTCDQNFTALIQIKITTRKLFRPHGISPWMALIDPAVVPLMHEL